MLGIGSRGDETRDGSMEEWDEKSKNCQTAFFALFPDHVDLNQDSYRNRKSILSNVDYNVFLVVVVVPVVVYQQHQEVPQAEAHVL